ncbi:hypothetical protein BKA65DRAFT_557451 [Rhexocercosporidium sp. MPI-PUGE-AT-0058]|nr:hypothetical protein BKA65DRAFT_557451 [Rhexocercosporidium sp. MPI-PUGE-AT-0058]
MPLEAFAIESSGSLHSSSALMPSSSSLFGPHRSRPVGAYSRIQLFVIALSASVNGLRCQVSSADFGAVGRSWQKTFNNDGDFSLTEFFEDDISKYAILSHRWEAGEVIFKDLADGTSKGKAG